MQKLPKSEKDLLSGVELDNGDVVPGHPVSQLPQALVCQLKTQHDSYNQTINCCHLKRRSKILVSDPGNCSGGLRSRFSILLPSPSPLLFLNISPSSGTSAFFALLRLLGKFLREMRSLIMQAGLSLSHTWKWILYPLRETWLRTLVMSSSWMQSWKKITSGMHSRNSLKRLMK